VSASSDRAVSTVLGSVLLVGIVVGLAVVVGGAVLATTVQTEPPGHARLDCRADPGTDRIACTHTGGDPLDLGTLRVRVTVGGEGLAHQPPVPFFAARGFHAGPTGPFNSAADPHWSAGETAALELAATNRPGLTPGTRVVVRVVSDRTTVARASTVA